MKNSLPLKLKRLLLFTALFVSMGITARGRNLPFLHSPEARVKNVILLISDGTSFSTISLARWLQRYENPDSLHLAIDPFMRGTVITYSSNAPIGDSAPTTACFMTGVPSISGFISTYPHSDGANDLIPLDSSRAYAPLLTLLEAARLERGMRTGLVVTCEYPHATPADCAAHHPKRNRKDILSSQMVHNGLDVVIGGGTKYLTKEDKDYLEELGYEVIFDDLPALRASKNPRTWALFDRNSFPYEIDRDTAIFPALAESTQIAINKLNEKGEGFFLMVEGSQVDWAAHANDAHTMAREFLAFDAACKVALDFAKQDGNTAVVIVSDHGNSGLAIGREEWPNYDRYSQEELFDNVANYRHSAQEMGRRLKNTPPAALDSLFLADFNLMPSAEQKERIFLNRNYNLSPISLEERKARNPEYYKMSLQYLVTSIVNDHLPFGFTTHGHSGEEVFLASYHPREGFEARGALQNYTLHRYMAAYIGFPNGIDHLNDRYFVPHRALFPALATSSKRNRIKESIDTTSNPLRPTLALTLGKSSLKAVANTNLVYIHGEPKRLKSLIIYSAERNEFFLPRDLKDVLKN